MTQTIFISGNTFILHPSGCIFWKEQNMLLIADVHLGKVAHFRKAGFAVPPNSISGNFKQMDNVIGFFLAEKICFLGDLFHSVINNEWAVFEDWINKISVNVILIAGNHDIINPENYRRINIPVVSEWVLDGFLLTHHPEDREGLFNFAGHIHPGIKLRGNGRQSVKLPCFFKKENQLILPAFGDFTGTFLLVPTKNDCVYAVTKDEVILICD
jgi:DNA ligase-associated metallophosphoesterase